MNLTDLYEHRESLLLELAILKSQIEEVNELIKQEEQKQNG